MAWLLRGEEGQPKFHSSASSWEVTCVFTIPEISHLLLLSVLTATLECVSLTFSSLVPFIVTESDFSPTQIPRHQESLWYTCAEMKILHLDRHRCHMIKVSNHWALW